MTITIDRIKASYGLIYISIFLLGLNFLIFSGLNLIEGGGAKNILRFLSLFFLIMVVFINGKIKKYDFLFFLLLFIIFLVNLNDLALNLVYIFVFFMALRNISIEHIIGKSFFIFLFLSAVHIFLYFFGFLNESITNYDNRVRYSFGFENVNKLSVFYYTLFAFSFLYFKKTTLIGKILSVFVGLLSFYFIILSDSRTALFCMMLNLVLLLLIKFDLFRFILEKINPFLLSFFVVFSLYLSSDYGMYFNSILSYRPEYFNNYIDFIFLDYFGFFFGVGIYDAYPIDNSYLLFLGSVGFIFSFIFMLFMFICTLKNKIVFDFFPIVFSTLLYGVFESVLIRPEFFLSILVLYVYLFGVDEASR